MPVISERKHKGYLFKATLPDYKQTYVLFLTDFTPVADSEHMTCLERRNKLEKFDTTVLE